IDHDLGASTRDAHVILLACPSQALGETCRKVNESLGTERPRYVISLSKGLELVSHRRPSEVIAAELLPGMAGSLTGPTNAAEVARGLPAAMVLGTDELGSGVHEVQAALSGPTLR